MTSASVAPGSDAAHNRAHAETLVRRAAAAGRGATVLRWNNYMLAARFVPPPRAPFLRACEWEEKEN